jgi:hypothetical protein
MFAKGQRLCFAHVEIYVTTYGEANLVAATSSETTRRVRPHRPEAMAHHPTGITVEIVDVEAGNHGRSCEEPAVCGDFCLALWSAMLTCRTESTESFAEHKPHPPKNHAQFLGLIFRYLR